MEGRTGVWISGGGARTVDREERHEKSASDSDGRRGRRAPAVPRDCGGSGEDQEEEEEDGAMMHGRWFASVKVNPVCRKNVRFYTQAHGLFALRPCKEIFRTGAWSLPHHNRG